MTTLKLEKLKNIGAAKAGVALAVAGVAILLAILATQPAVGEPVRAWLGGAGAVISGWFPG